MTVRTIESVSRIVIDRTPERVQRFLYAISADPEIDAALTRAGYTEEDHEEGWGLLKRVGARQPKPQTNSDPRSIAAIEELDAWDEPNFRRIDAALAHLF